LETVCFRAKQCSLFADCRTKYEIGIVIDGNETVCFCSLCLLIPYFLPLIVFFIIFVPILHNFPTYRLFFLRIHRFSTSQRQNDDVLRYHTLSMVRSVSIVSLDVQLIPLKMKYEYFLRLCSIFWMWGFWPMGLKWSDINMIRLKLFNDNIQPIVVKVELKGKFVLVHTKLSILPWGCVGEWNHNNTVIKSPILTWGWSSICSIILYSLSNGYFTTVLQIYWIQSRPPACLAVQLRAFYPGTAFYCMMRKPMVEIHIFIEVCSYCRLSLISEGTEFMRYVQKCSSIHTIPALGLTHTPVLGAQEVAYLSRFPKLRDNTTTNCNRNNSM
jgi:hypothetical protein